MNILSNFKVWMVFLLLIVSSGIILFGGLNFGIDFTGGTIFQIHLDEKLSPQEMERVSQVFEQRLNWTGLKDIRVFTLSNEFVVIQIAESDPDEIQKIESILKKQGRFDARFEGETLFDGSDIIAVDSSAGYNVAPFNERETGGLTEWKLGFTLKSSAAQDFMNSIFHKCQLLSLGTSDSQGQYDCPFTYLFIDRPSDSIIISTSLIDSHDEDLFLAGNSLEGISEGTSFDEVKLNSGISYLILSSEKTLTNEDTDKLKELFDSGKKKVIVSESLSDEIKNKFIGQGFKLSEINEESSIPFFWQASGLKQIVSLNPSITGDNPYVENVEQQQIITDLIIEGTEQNYAEAKNERNETKTLLQTGSLPVSVESISKETISPLLGSSFLHQAGVIALIVLIAVSGIIFIRYRKIKLSAAIAFTSLTEAFGTLAITSLLGNIDLASIAGIIAAVGTGVDDQIIITDELSRKNYEADLSIVTRIKKAFFIIFAAAATSIATMLPIIIFGFAMIKILGFAFATIIGVLIGVLITRPFYAEIVKKLL